jgi:hypothetical protein
MNRSRARVWIPWVIMLVILALAASFIWWKWNQLVPVICQPSLESQQEAYRRQLEALKESTAPAQPGEPPAAPPVTGPGSPPPITGPGSAPPVKPMPTPPSLPGAQPEMPPPPEGPSQAAPSPGPTEAEQRWARLTGFLPQWPKDFPAIKDGQAARDMLVAICQELDTRPYLRGRLPEGGTFQLFVESCKILNQHRPIGSGELFRFESILSNVFHFFRRLGEDRIDLFRLMVTRESELAEPIAMAFYSWMSACRDCGAADEQTHFHMLYDYAAYFTNTMGGEMYIYRRAPKIAGLTLFYSLVILDQAMQRGLNPHGVDPRLHIRYCRDLLKGQDLIFKDRYRQVLQELESRWNTP